MARHLPLYGADISQAVQRVIPEDLNPGCTDCALHEGVATRCMRPEGKPGGLLVVSDYPAQAEDRRGRPFCGHTGVFLRQLLSKYWSGPIALDNAIKCAPGARKVTVKMVDACRPYAAAVLMDVKPTRVLAIGANAFKVLFDRAPNALSIRRGYTYLPFSTSTYTNNTPVFFLPNATFALRNTFLTRWFEEDVKWALTTPDPPLPPWDEHTSVVETEEDARRVLAEARVSRRVNFDCETSGQQFDPDFRLLSIAMSFNGDTHSWVFDETALANRTIANCAIEILSKLDVGKCGSNIKYDILAVRCGFQNLFGIDVVTGPVSHDAQLIRHLVDTEADADLETQAELVGMGGHKDEAQLYTKAACKQIRDRAGAVKRAAKKAERAGSLWSSTPEERQILHEANEPMAYAYQHVPVDVLSRYNALDTVTTGMLAETYEGHLNENPEQRFVWNELTGPASSAFAQIETWGMPISKIRVDRFAHHLASEIRAIEARILKVAGPDFNPASSKQVRELLFKKLKLKPLKKSEKSGLASTDAATLDSLKGQHEIIDELLEHRKYQKLQGTYGEGMLKHIRADGRIHTSFKLDGARSGRLSSRDPNLQNIPRADEDKKGRNEGKAARDLFQVPHGKRMVSLDYSQLELRIAADLSGDPAMRQIFIDGKDFHWSTARLISKIVWGIAPELVTKKHRSLAKVFVFGLLYGMTDNGIVARTGCTKDEAATVRKAILGQFSLLDKWVKERLKETRKTGYTWTYWKGQRARRRALWQIGDHDEGKRIVAENGSFNTPVQGTGSDYCLASVIALVNWILEEQFPAKLICTVHDSIMFEVDEPHLDELIFTAKNTMESWPTMTNVPIVVDVEVGDSWGSLTKYKECEQCALWYVSPPGQPEDENICVTQRCQDAFRAAALLTQSNIGDGIV